MANPKVHPLPTIQDLGNNLVTEVNELTLVAFKFVFIAMCSYFIYKIFTKLFIK